MEICARVAHVLGRELSEDEAQLLGFLSPQGVAKFNTDMCKGAPLASPAQLGLLN